MLIYRRGISAPPGKPASAKPKPARKAKVGAAKWTAAERKDQLRQAGEAARYMRLNNLTKASAAICNTTFGEDVGLDDVTGTGIPIFAGRNAQFCGQMKSVKRWPLLNAKLLQRAYDRGDQPLMGVGHYIMTKSEENHLVRPKSKNRTIAPKRANRCTRVFP